MKKNIKRYIFGFLVIINCIIIFCFSNQVADDSSKTSSKVVDFVCEIIPQLREMKEPDKTILREDILTPIVRKTAHFSIYAMLGILSVNFMLTFKELSIYKKGLISLLFCITYATSDEIHQLFIIGRSCELRDVLIDSLGALVGILFTITIYKIIKNIKTKKVGKET